LRIIEVDVEQLPDVKLVRQFHHAERAPTEVEILPF